MINFIKQNSSIKDLYLNETIINKVVNSFKKELLRNKNILLELYKMDNEESQIIFNIDSILKLIDLYSLEEIKNKEKELIVACYEGSPYITINLCMQTLTKKRGTIAIIEDSMLAINSLLITIFNGVLEEYRIAKMIELYNKVDIEKIKEIQNETDYIVCIGNSYTYYKYCKEGIKNLKYVPFKNFAIYCENERFEEIKYEIYKYATRMGIEAEIYEYLEEFIECVNDDKTLESIVVFSENEGEIEKCKIEIKDLKLFINENPFKNENFKITIE